MPKDFYPSEYTLGTLIARWMSIQYPSVLFHFDLSGLRLTIGLAVKCKSLNPRRGWPDLFIAEARGQFKGLFIELKKSHDVLYTQKGKLRKDEHIQEQAQMLAELEVRGFRAVFACGFEECQKIIREYLSLASPEPLPSVRPAIIHPDDGQVTVRAGHKRFTLRKL